MLRILKGVRSGRLGADGYGAVGDIGEDVFGPFVVIGQHLERDPFMADAVVDTQARASGVVEAAVFLLELSADFGEKVFITLIKSTAV